MPLLSYPKTSTDLLIAVIICIPTSQYRSNRMDRLLRYFTDFRQFGANPHHYLYLSTNLCTVPPKKILLMPKGSALQSLQWQWCRRLLPNMSCTWKRYRAGGSGPWHTHAGAWFSLWRSACSGCRLDIGPAFETVKVAPHAAGKFQFYDLRLNNLHPHHRSFKDVSSLIFDGYFRNVIMFTFYPYTCYEHCDMNFYFILCIW